MLSHVRGAISINWVTNFLKPFITDDKFLNYTPDELQFRVNVNTKVVRQVGRVLRDHGFTGEFWYGVTKIVFPHEDGFVLKVPIIEDFAPFLVEEAQFFQEIPLHWRRNFAYTACSNENLGIIFQETAPPDKLRFFRHRRKIERMEKELGLCDIHHNNVGFNPYTDFLIIDAQKQTTLETLREWDCGGRGKLPF